MEIKVEDFDDNCIFIWTPEKFREKYYLMRELWEYYGDINLDCLKSYRGTMTYMAPEIKERKVYKGT